MQMRELGEWEVEHLFLLLKDMCVRVCVCSAHSLSASSTEPGQEHIGRLRTGKQWFALQRQVARSGAQMVTGGCCRR
jgi:hypothetical protein